MCASDPGVAARQHHFIHLTARLFGNDSCQGVFTGLNDKDAHGAHASAQCRHFINTAQEEHRQILLDQALIDG